MKSDPFYAFVGVVNKLGRTPKGFDRKGRRADVIFKAIFKASKKTVTEIWEIYTQHLIAQKSATNGERNSPAKNSAFTISVAALAPCPLPWVLTPNT